MKTNELLENSILYRSGEHKIEDIEQELDETRMLYQTILKFQIQAYHRQISQLTHYNVLYEQLLQGLRIPELMNELKQKSETFSQVIESIASEKLSIEKQKQDAEARRRYEENKEQMRLDKEQREQQEKTRKEQIEQQNKVIQTITYILLPATLTTGILGMNIPFIAESKNTLFLPVFLAVIVCTAAMSMFINKFENIKARLILVVSVILLIFFIVLTVKDYKKTEKVQQKVAIEELCEQIEGCTFLGDN